MTQQWRKIHRCPVENLSNIFAVSFSTNKTRIPIAQTRSIV